MFAIIKSGGRQYKVSVGQKLEVNRLAVEGGEELRFGEVLLISDADRSLVGAPYVENAEVVATVNGHARGEKLIVFKYKSKKRYRHRRGHRQELTVLTINDILAEGKSLVTGEAPKAKAEPIDESSVVLVAESHADTTETPQKTRRRRTSGTEETAEAASSTEE